MDDEKYQYPKGMTEAKLIKMTKNIDFDPYKTQPLRDAIGVIIDQLYELQLAIGLIGMNHEPKKRPRKAKK